MHFSESLQGSKLAITMRPVYTESTLLLFLLIWNLPEEMFELQKLFKSVSIYF